MNPVLDTYKLLLFDFDFTLADCSGTICYCISESLRRMALPVPDETAIRATIGMTMPDTLERLTGVTDSRKAEDFLQYFREFAEPRMIVEAQLYPGVSELLHALNTSGFTLAIVSTKPAEQIRGILARYDCEACFSVLIGGDEVRSHKPNPEPLLEAIRRVCMGVINPTFRKQTLMIGDSLMDALAAERAGVGFIGVLSGPTPALELMQYPHVAIVKDVTRLG